MASPNPPRERDDLILKWLIQRKQGATVDELAAASGFCRSFVDKATRAVREDDLRKSGEDPQKVDRFYWRARKKKGTP
jgi:hypothetical protein